MWQKSYSTVITGIQPSQIWRVWSDVSLRASWDDDTEWAKADGPFENGMIMTMKPKGWPKTVSMKIMDCIPDQAFTDHTKFLLADMYVKHSMEKHEDGLILTTTLKIVGPFSWIWRKIVAEEIVATLPQQTESLVKMARQFA